MGGSESETTRVSSTRPAFLLLLALGGCGPCAPHHVHSIETMPFLVLQVSQKTDQDVIAWCKDCFLNIWGADCDCGASIYREIVWSTSEPSVVSVTSLRAPHWSETTRTSVRLAALREGAATVTASYRGLSGSIKVTVEGVTDFRIAANGARADGGEMLVQSGEIFSLRPIGRASDTGARVSPTVDSWISSDRRIVDPSGVGGQFWALDVGTATVTATSGALSATTQVIVGLDALEFVGPQSVAVGQEVVVEVHAKTPGGPGATRPAGGASTLTWKASNQKVRLAPNAGPSGEVQSGSVEVTGVESGVVTLTVTGAGVVASREIRVE